MNDLNKLQILYEQNKYILSQKDNYKRTLLHLSVIGEYYSISKFLLEKGINFDEPDCFLSTALYYARDNIKELLESFGANEVKYNDNPDFIPKGIDINISDKNKIELICNNFMKSHIINKIELIKKNKEIIGKRLF